MKDKARVSLLLAWAVLGLVGLGMGQQSPRPKLRVVATLPVLADLARQVGGDHVQVVSLGKGQEDPHYVTPTPSLMQAVRRADLFIEVGMSLEMWAVNVLDGAGNKRVRRESKGHVYASEGIPVLEVPVSMTRAKGDLHPNGNPHLWVDPVRLGLMARNIEKGMERVRPSEARWFQEGYVAFQKRLDLAIYGPELVKLLGGKVLNRLALSGKLQSFLKRKYKGKPLSARLGGFLKLAAPLRGRKILFYHQNWIYFSTRFGLEVRGFVEDKPGITPSASHKLKLMEQIKAEKIKVLGTATWNDDSVPNALARETGIQVVPLPAMVGATKDAPDSISMIRALITRLLNGYSKG